MAEKIVKLVYDHKIFDVLENKEELLYRMEILPEGMSVLTKYSEKQKPEKMKQTFSPELFDQLCEDLKVCIDTADRTRLYIDDVSEELSVYYESGDIKTFDRGYGNSRKVVNDIIFGFMTSICVEY